MKKLLAAASVAVALCTGCGSQPEPATSASSATSAAQTLAPDQQAYSSAEDLANGLSRKGIACEPFSMRSTDKSTIGTCDGLSLTVWGSDDDAVKGVEAMAAYHRTANGITGGINYLISGQNWLIDTEDQVVANAISSRFGGTLQAIS